MNKNIFKFLNEKKTIAKLSIAALASAAAVYGGTALCSASAMMSTVPTDAPTTAAASGTTTTVPFQAELNNPNPLMGQSKFKAGVPVAPSERADKDAATGKNKTPGDKNLNQVSFDSGARFFMLTENNKQSTRRDKTVREDDTEITIAEANNKALYEYLAAHPNDEMAKLPCEVVFNEVELARQGRTGATYIFNDPNCRDNLSVALKMKEKFGSKKVAVITPASEVTVGGAPAVSKAAEESEERRTSLYAFETGGDMDHYYIQNNAPGLPEGKNGFHYNPNKCAIAKGALVYPVDEKGNLQPIDPEQIPTMHDDKVDFLIHASRNMNPTCCEQMPCILPEIDLSDLLTSSTSSQIDATYMCTKKVFDRQLKRKVDVTVTVPIFGTITADKKLTNVTTTSGIDDIATHLAEKIAPLTKTTPDEIAQKLKNRWSDKFREEIQDSANQIIKLAVARGYDTLVINNLGGGIFLNGITTWAEAWANAIRDFGGNLTVVFAMFDGDAQRKDNLASLYPAEKPRSAEFKTQARDKETKELLNNPDGTPKMVPAANFESLVYAEALGDMLTSFNPHLVADK